MMIVIMMMMMKMLTVTPLLIMIMLLLITIKKLRAIRRNLMGKLLCQEFKSIILIWIAMIRMVVIML